MQVTSCPFSLHPSSKDKTLCPHPTAYRSVHQWVIITLRALDPSLTLTKPLTRFHTPCINDRFRTSLPRPPESISMISLRMSAITYSHFPRLLLTAIISIGSSLSFCGKITDVAITEGSSEKSQTAIVSFEKPTAAKTALMLNGASPCLFL